MCCNQQAPSAPNYTGIAAADATQASNNYKLGQQQFQWGKDQFNKVWPYAQNYMAQQTASSGAQTAAAGQAQANYNETYLPIEKQFAHTAATYNSPGEADAQAGAAMGDVANTFNQSRSAAAQHLESYGIDPSQTRYQALDLSSRVGQAAATAAAGTQSRINTQNEGLALKGAAINTGRGYPSAVTGMYGGATGSGAAGIGSANSTVSTGSSVTGSPASFMGLSQGALSGETGALNTSFNNNMAGANFNANQTQQMGNFAGMAGMMGMTAMGI